MSQGILSRLVEFWRDSHGLTQSRSPEVSALLQGEEKKFLHVGCGPARKPDVGPGLVNNDWREIRLDIDQNVAPDIVSSMLDMSVLPSACVDAVYSSHNIEHLYPHEVPLALAEFWRVLKPEGLLIMTCPDLQSLAQLIVADRLGEPAYVAQAGPITPLDVLYGHGPELARGNLYMAHHTGFTRRTLVNSARAAGFASVAARRREPLFDLWIVATKNLRTEMEMQQLADEHLPPAQ